eukprot:g17151.t1
MASHLQTTGAVLASQSAGEQVDDHDVEFMEHDDAPAGAFAANYVGETNLPAGAAVTEATAATAGPQVFRPAPRRKPVRPARRRTSISNGAGAGGDAAAGGSTSRRSGASSAATSRLRAAGFHVDEGDADVDNGHDAGEGAEEADIKEECASPDCAVTTSPEAADASTVAGSSPIRGFSPNAGYGSSPDQSPMLDRFELEPTPTEASPAAGQRSPGRGFYFDVTGFEDHRATNDDIDSHRLTTVGDDIGARTAADPELEPAANREDPAGVSDTLIAALGGLSIHDARPSSERERNSEETDTSNEESSSSAATATTSDEAENENSASDEQAMEVDDDEPQVELHMVRLQYEQLVMYVPAPRHAPVAAVIGTAMEHYYRSIDRSGRAPEQFPTQFIPLYTTLRAVQVVGTGGSRGGGGEDMISVEEQSGADEARMSTKESQGGDQEEMNSEGDEQEEQEDSVAGQQQEEQDEGEGLPSQQVVEQQDDEEMEGAETSGRQEPGSVEDEQHQQTQPAASLVWEITSRAAVDVNDKLEAFYDFAAADGSVVLELQNAMQVIKEGIIAHLQ